MGRRKERRLAAMSATGRRVKLDLFAEPSGDLGGSSAQNEVGGDGDDTENHAGLPNSPSTSDFVYRMWLWYWEHSIGDQTTTGTPATVIIEYTSDLLCPFVEASFMEVWRVDKDILPLLDKQRENPLVLLGQYSDDEMDDGPSGEQVQAVSGDTSVIVDDQEKLNAAQENEDFGFKEGNGPGALNAEHLEAESPLQLLDSLEKTEVDGSTYNHGADSGVMPEEIGVKEPASAISDMLAVGDVILGWKVVFHEETNRYYYWNTSTGETSWEVPDVLAQTTESTYGKKDAVDTGEIERATAMFTNQSTEICGSNACKPSMESLSEDCKSEMLEETKGNTDLEQNQLYSSSPLNGAQNHVTSPGGNLLTRKSADASDENANSVESVMHGTGAELASSLMKHSEHLLEQLNSVIGSKCNLQGYNQILKSALEVEMRLADMKSLASYGSSLLPFWLHSERQLQKLEIDVCDILRGLESGQFKEVSAGHESHENICDVSGINHGEKNAVCSSGDSGVPDSTGIVTLQKNDIEVYSRGVSGSELVSSDGCLATYSDINEGRKGEVDGIVGPCEATPETLLHSVEEIDMDIDMEVEDATPTCSSTVVNPSGAQQYIPSAGQESATGGQMCSVPPPPEEEWIPPPPPDEEPFPPPPPDEPPEIPYSQPSDLVLVQSFSYAEQYMSYTVPNYGYYMQANTDLASSNLYVTAEACQPTLPQHAMYFEAAVPNGYGPATVSVNPVEPSVYYTLQDGTAQLPMESSVSHSSTVSKTSISEAMGPLDTHVEVESSSLFKKVNVPAINGEPKKASLDIQSSQACPHDLTTILVTESSSLPSVPAATASVAPATTKSQSKVLRNKKRSVTTVSSLKSNKKVSSLVDKWKAAKEELQEEEEEPKNAYEILEKKRQREIEEWHAQQIVSGAAKDNANFQPLGGDWRERVKRKRAQLASEPLQARSDTVTEGNLQPDLDELTRSLPSGWQAYWDDSSKQIYYGNNITSETTWIRPTS